MRLAVENARVCLRRSLAIRANIGVPVDFAASAVDMAQMLGVEVWFKALPSLAGMYERSREVIVIGSERPLGYQASVCAHELGHHVFGHGTRIDEYITEGSPCDREDPDETTADLFSAHLLMPEAAVRHAFNRRGWDPKAPTTTQVFVVAGVLGVGYAALVNHLTWTLEYLSPRSAKGLLAESPHDIRQQIVKRVVTSELLVVDDQWSDRPVDATFGTVICLPPTSRIEGNAIQIVDSNDKFVMVRAKRRGLVRVNRGDWTVFVRVMPDKYSGMAVHRHMEDPDES